MHPTRKSTMLWKINIEFGQGVHFLQSLLFSPWLNNYNCLFIGYLIRIILKSGSTSIRSIDTFKYEAQIYGFIRYRKSKSTFTMFIDLKETSLFLILSFHFNFAF